MLRDWFAEVCWGLADFRRPLVRWGPCGSSLQQAHHRRAVPHLQHHCHVGAAGLPLRSAGASRRSLLIPPPDTFPPHSPLPCGKGCGLINPVDMCSLFAVSLCLCKHNIFLVVWLHASVRFRTHVTEVDGGEEGGSNASDQACVRPYVRECVVVPSVGERVEAISYGDKSSRQWPVWVNLVCITAWVAGCRTGASPGLVERGICCGNGQ